ncbi:MAG TPA: (5-formylfuran-3-yl)methyl phosphate synthase, partial [Methanothrix sp.]|nr:(5-formylfuran-3-yl)methyl phosphate synthase [Methanothrix sp.]
MRLLVSPMNVTEARSALLGGADILDVKNPKEGSLGANFPWAIRAVV